MPKPLIPHGDVTTAYIGLLCQGKSDFDHIEAYREGRFFQDAFHLKAVQSSPTLRQRLDRIASEPVLRDVLRQESIRLLQRAKPKLKPVTEAGHIPRDIDVSPFDNSHTKKEGIGWTYKKFDGYAPIFAYLGKEGYGLAAELRSGSVNGQKDAPAFLNKVIKYAQSVVGQRPLLVRTDSGHDSADNIDVFLRTGAAFLIKRNLRRVAPESFLETAQLEQDPVVEERPGKRAWRGTVQKYFVLSGDEAKPTWIPVEENVLGARVVYQSYVVTERTTEANGQILLTPSVEADVWWHSLEFPVPELERLYHDHGASAQFHGELKTDMDLERLPSGKFETNALVLELGLFAYNILRIMGQGTIGNETVPLRKQAERCSPCTASRPPEDHLKTRIRNQQVVKKRRSILRCPFFAQNPGAEASEACFSSARGRKQPCSGSA